MISWICYLWWAVALVLAWWILRHLFRAKPDTTTETIVEAPVTKPAEVAAAPIKVDESVPVDGSASSIGAIATAAAVTGAAAVTLKAAKPKAAKKATPAKPVAAKAPAVKAAAPKAKAVVKAPVVKAPAKAAPKAAAKKPAVAKPATLNADLAKASGFKPKGLDDLVIIEGIGPKIKELFHADGIKTFAELAATPTKKMQGILDAAGPKYKLANPSSWAKQAGLAAKNKWADLRKLQDELSGGVKK